MARVSNLAREGGGCLCHIVRPSVFLRLLEKPSHSMSRKSISVAPEAKEEQMGRGGLEAAKCFLNGLKDLSFTRILILQVLIERFERSGRRCRDLSVERLKEAKSEAFGAERADLPHGLKDGPPTLERAASESQAIPHQRHHGGESRHHCAPQSSI